MSEWDYGQGEQIADEFAQARREGKCHLCLIRPVNGKYLCGKCEQEIEDTNLHDDARYD